ncbi:hypothetical protein [Pelagimonas varians]|uniref:Uncharacterized protein n=1 Tax=Pelagimonas varians TaxID=696760 RepID=A0A238KQ69_9RHOB|nr:hypothetical protein [Pelagimonas varians]PYG28506.1 hypothetical protein C8N36_1114 [Pelagimonas varians]SMX44963.1 hypothetical protein PEV8663_02926 [Pelagimonas varians]
MKRFILAATLAFAATVAQADQLIGSYVAYIGQDDLYNSKGARLSEPWQILRQDRANYHRFGISQGGDEWDPFFGSIENRGIMERMIMNGSIEPAAARNLVRGGATVFVRIYGTGNQGRYVNVTVTR